MADELENGTNTDIEGASGGNPQETNTENNKGQNAGTLLGGTGTDKGGDTEPKEPTVYDFTSAFEGGQVDEQIAADFSKLLNGVGATQEQAVELAKFGSQYATNIVTEYETQRQNALEEQYQGYADNAKEVLGNKFDETVAKAGAGVEVVEKTIPNIREILGENGTGNRVEIIQLFAAIADMAGEDVNSGNRGGNNAITTEEQLADAIYGKK